MEMIRFCLKHIVQMLIFIVFVSTLTFFLVRIAPGDPAYLLLTANGVPVSEEALMSLRQELGLTESLGNQYVQWIANVFTWQWGTSYVSKEPV
ncbi:UNVERIFIED_CONTAM: hypothetical protein PO554_26850, partial [Klebsiella pneumoniae]